MCINIFMGKVAGMKPLLKNNNFTAHLKCAGRQESDPANIWENILWSKALNLMLPSASSGTIRSARLCSGDAFISSDGGPLNSGGRNGCSSVLRLQSQFSSYETVYHKSTRVSI